MILSYSEIIELILSDVVKGSSIELVNAASLDIQLGNTVMIEHDFANPIIDLRDRKPLAMRTALIPAEGYMLRPGEFILAHSLEVFNLPDDISAQYHLKSSMGRIGLDHCLAGWCDAGWHGSVLTLELKNVSRFHTVRLFAGDLIGQMVFHRHELVPRHASYAAKGRYNGDLTVKGMKA
jgi:dCTP deaminase